MEGAHLASIGEQVDLTYPTEHLGEGPDALAKVLKGSPILKKLQEAKHPAVIVGPGILNRPDRAAVLQQVGFFLRICLPCVQINSGVCDSPVLGPPFGMLPIQVTI